MFHPSIHHPSYINPSSSQVPLLSNGQSNLKIHTNENSTEHFQAHQDHLLGLLAFFIYLEDPSCAIELSQATPRSFGSFKIFWKLTRPAIES
ncbi:hypothetical protein HGRIS_011654 [Hohenbuehelia grisea]|uniref:Uncharacterized protein n=1 Tax=Hohenbuehelia grisea TaxID=104357 RepID=A0ABR3JXZ0_9AGAR